MRQSIVCNQVPYRRSLLKESLAINCTNLIVRLSSHPSIGSSIRREFRRLTCSLKDVVLHSKTDSECLNSMILSLKFSECTLSPVETVDKTKTLQRTITRETAEIRRSDPPFETPFETRFMQSTGKTRRRH